MSTQTSTIPAVGALNQLNEIVTAYWKSQLFVAACKLQIFEHLSEGPASASSLSQELGVHQDPLYRVLLGLCQIGLLERRGDTFANTSTAEYLTSRSPAPMAPLMEWVALFSRNWEHLDDAVREYEHRWNQAYGMPSDASYQDWYADMRTVETFAGMMNAYSIPQGQLIAEKFDFTRHRCILDAGGGPGGISIEIGRKHPHLHGIIMDLPPVCKIAEQGIRAAGLQNRFVTSQADLLTGPYPSGADAILLGWILQDWDDNNCRAILKNCFQALPSGGKLLIVDSILDDNHGGSTFGVMMSLSMLVLRERGARERSVSDHRALLEEAGFELEEVLRMDAPRDLLIARKP